MSDKKSMKEVESYRQQILDDTNIGGKLEKIMEKQKEFGSKFCKFGELTLDEKQKWTKEFVLCCLDELSEILNQQNWKHWKKPEPVDEIEMKYELIDLLHFLISMMLVWEMDANEVYSMYLAKNKENNLRQRRGY
jgi:dimeric dUTPase (all-alpha-NTP-PPase superfamily)